MAQQTSQTLVSRTAPPNLGMADSEKEIKPPTLTVTGGTQYDWPAQQTSSPDPIWRLSGTVDRLGVSA
jgi:hypothetical protein